jgi:hypothetical protein
MALAFLLIVFLFVIALIALFAYPPTRWVEYFGKDTKKK